MKLGKISPLEQISTRISAFLSSRGYSETISYSFVDPTFQEAIYPGVEKLQLVNPISQDLSEMRSGLWPGLLASMVYNTNRQQNVIKFFESGVVFDINQGLLEERACIAGLITGEQGSLNWSETAKKFDFYDLKGDLQALFDVLNLKDVCFTETCHEALHPGQSAQIMINGKPAGLIGVLHPHFQDELDITSEVILFELSLAALINKVPARFQAISKYPQIRRDLAFLVGNDITAQQIETVIREVITDNWLKGFDVFDIYMGDSIPEGKKSLAVALTLQDDNRTLVDSEINAKIDAILKRLYNEFAIILRD
jgi:phenylalanyl-tRNA synthetase beta chain